MTKKITTQPINAAILARVSTARQEDNSSLESQLDKSRRYCQQHDYTVIAEKRETISGAFVLARSEFNDLLQMAADGSIQVIVVDIPDRLGRGDAIAKLELLAEMNGARIEYVAPGRDKSTLEGMAMAATDQLVSGIERLNIRRRTVAGKIDWAKRGRIIMAALRPYGYKVINKYDERGRKISSQLEIIESEAAIVRSMYEWCVFEGVSIREIVRRLSEQNAAKITDTDPAYQAVWSNIHTAKRRKGWGRSTVAKILANPLYKGEWHYGKHEIERIDTPDGIVKRQRRRKDDETVMVNVPCIITADMWEAAQEQLAENRKKFVKPSVAHYLLRGRIKCARCGVMYVGGFDRRKDGSLYRYYRCEHRCPACILNGDLAESVVWQSIRDAMLEPDRLWLGIRKQREEKTKARRLIEQSIAALEVQNSKAQERLNRLLDLYSSGDLDKGTYRAKRQEIDREIEKRKTEQAELADRLGECAILTPEQEAILREFQAEVSSRMTGDVPFAERAKLIDLLRVNCVYNPETGELLICGLMGTVTLSTKSLFRGQCASRLGFSIVVRIANGKAERLADNFFAVAARKRSMIVAESEARS